MLTQRQDSLEYDILLIEREMLVGRLLKRSQQLLTDAQIDLRLGRHFRTKLGVLLGLVVAHEAA